MPTSVIETLEKCIVYLKVDRDRKEAALRAVQSHFGVSYEFLSGREVELLKIVKGALAHRKEAEATD